MEELEHLLCEERLKELSVLRLESRGLKGSSSLPVDIQQMGMRKRERLWAVVPRDRTSDSGHRLKHTKLLRTKENAFYHEGGKGGIREPLPLEFLKPSW